MILDILENADQYLKINGNFAKAFEFLKRPDLDDLPAGRYAIDGRRVYAVVAKEPGRKKEDAQLETHERYIDIQCVLAGTDEMGWKPKLGCRHPSGAYDAESDLLFFADAPDVWFPVARGSFAVFFPEDAHMPLISEGRIHKIIVKVALDSKDTE